MLYFIFNFVVEQLNTFMTVADNRGSTIFVSSN